MKVLHIGWNSVRRMLREPSNLFFVFVFPMLLIIVLGASFGGGFTPRLGIIVDSGDGEFSDQLVAALEADDDLETSTVGTQATLTDGVERGRFDAGLVIPDDYDRQLAGGEPATVFFVGTDELASRQIRTKVDAIVAEQNIAWVAVAAVGGTTASDRTEVLTAAAALRDSVGDVTVAITSTGEAVFPKTLGQFDLGASQQLLLFIFLTSLSGSAALVQSRQWGVTRRMVATPTHTSQIIGGEGLGRYLVALVQGVFIMIGTLLIFGVNWGDPVGATAILLIFCAVGAGAGMLVGSIANNDQQAGSFGVFAALGVAALGGCMVPIEFFPDAMQTVAHLTPHAWGLDAFAELVRRDGTIADITAELTVLALFAVGLLALASWRLRKTLTT
ncbi:MAG TPA: ABC transporter permease [Acidimicrobiia bacterium]|nr:ABC transporter permease [Acidimicrobiia bacterium]